MLITPAFAQAAGAVEQGEALGRQDRVEDRLALGQRQGIEVRRGVTGKEVHLRNIVN